MRVTNSCRDRAVQNMFDRIARRYDLLNRVISFRFDRRWRRQAVRALLSAPSPLLLDIGTGTGDLAFEALAESGGRARAIGMDFSLSMLRLAQTKQRKAPHGCRAAWIMGSAMLAPFKDGVFDGVMTAFVLRNVSDLDQFFSEALRVLKPGGTCVSLDMFPPPEGWFAKLYGLYFYYVMPWMAGRLAGDREAYGYLSESVRAFHAPEKIARLIQSAGFSEVATRKFLCGAVCLHIARKIPSAAR